MMLRLNSIAISFYCSFVLHLLTRTDNYVQGQGCVEGSPGAPASLGGCQSTGGSSGLPVATIGGEPVTIQPTGAVFTPTAGGQPVTILPNQPTTIGTQVISIGSTGVVVDSSTLIFPTVSPETGTSSINTNTAPATTAGTTGPDGVFTPTTTETSSTSNVVPVIGPPTTTVSNGQTITLVPPIVGSPGATVSGSQTITSPPVTTTSTTGPPIPITVLFVTATNGDRGRTTPVTFISTSTSTSGTVDGRPTSYSGGTWKCQSPLCRPRCLFPLIPLLCPDDSGGGDTDFPPPPPGQPFPGPPGGTTPDESSESESRSCTRTATVPQCTVTISTIQTSGMTSASTTSVTSCSTITSCDARGATITTSTTTSEQAGPLPTEIPYPLAWDGDQNWHEEQQSFLAFLETVDAPDSTYTPTPTASRITGPATPSPHVPIGQAIAPNVELRILPLGDSITWGYHSGDGNGYRLELLNDLHADHVVFAGNESHGTMQDNWMAAWPGQTIQYIQEHMGPSIDQNPSIVLLHAGTNDLLPGGENPAGDPSTTADRLGGLVDQIIGALPNAVVLVAQIIPTNDDSVAPGHSERTRTFEGLVPAVVQPRADAGNKVLSVDFSSFPISLLQADGVHPTDEGYRRMGDIWYDALRGIPDGWIQPPEGNDPVRPPHAAGADPNANGGPDPVVATPTYGIDYVQGTNPAAVQSAASSAGQGGRVSCNSPPSFIGNSGTPKIAQGVGHNGDWHFNKNWISFGNTPFAQGIHLAGANVKLADMNGDGKADYLWVNPDTGELTCWINNYPGLYSPAGTNQAPRIGIIADGAGPGNQVFFADMNGNGKADYLVVDPNTGSVTVYWNEGPDPTAENGWRFNPGGIIATGVEHANLATLRFADTNGDGRADYVVAGVDGSLVNYINEGQPGDYHVTFINQSGIATGAEQDLSRLTLDDVDGDGRADYLIWDDQGGITGFLNIKTRSEGVPFFANQGPPKVIADGIGQDPSVIQLADLDGDGKKDYCYIDDAGALWLWWNRGAADTSVDADGVRFADMDGDGIDDYIWLDQATGAPTLYINRGPSSSDPLGWAWAPANPPVIASGAGARPLIHLADITGDGKSDYLVVNASNGAVDLYINGGADPTAANNWRFTPIGTIASGLGPGGNVRFGDIDGDGRADYLYLAPNGGLTVYRNQYRPNSLQTEFIELPGAAASGINQRPEDIDFRDMNGDGKVDYIYTHALDGEVYVYLNNYPNQPTWLPPNGPSQQPLGVSGQMVRWADLQGTGRASQVIVDPDTGAVSAFLNGCANRGASPCQAPKTTSGTAQFYYWETDSSNRQVPESYGITARVHWNSTNVERQAIALSPTNSFTDHSGYNDGHGDSFAVNGTDTDGSAECGQRGLVQFVRACDGSYNVVGTNGEIANCVHSGLPQPIDSANSAANAGIQYNPQLVCTGSLCQADQCPSPLSPGCS